MKQLVIVYSLLFVTSVTVMAQKKVTWKNLDSIAKNIDSIVYKRVDGKELQLYYCLAKSTKKLQKHPAVVFIHGGAWTGGAANVFYAYAAYLASKNIVGISIDYRLIQQPTDDIINCIADSKSAIRFIKLNANRFQIDTNKIVVCGESAGGHLAASIELFDGFNSTTDDTTISTKPAALILLNPVLNVATNTFLKYVDAAVLKSKNKVPDSATLAQKYMDKAISISPLFHVNKSLPPTLIINGTADKITPIEYAQAFTNKALQFKKNCELIALPNVGHAFAVPHYKASEANVVETLVTIESFLRKLKYLKGKSTIINGNDENWISKK